MDAKTLFLEQPIGNNNSIKFVAGALTLSQLHNNTGEYFSGMEATETKAEKRTKTDTFETATCTTPIIRDTRETRLLPRGKYLVLTDASR